VTAAVLDAALAAERLRVDRQLRALLAAERGVPARLRRAMAYSLFGGGKRLRPVLLLWTYDACRERAVSHPPVPRRRAVDAACALEMIHTYSLVHDDLPAMDDDVLRRGRPTCHVAYGEATAILAGDGLQALAFEVLASLGVAGTGAARLIAAAAGPAGMVGGQQEDLAASGRPVTGALIRRIHRLKTAAMIAAAFEAGGALAGGTVRRLAALNAAGVALGLAFQAADDLLDARGDPTLTGKNGGGDAAAGKATWVRLAGESAAARRMAHEGRRGQLELARALPGGPRSERLVALAARLWNRDR
jgi:geranylgeranyl pyrophosphate synthase